jgi:hypothetical protein
MPGKGEKCGGFDGVATKGANGPVRTRREAAMVGKRVQFDDETWAPTDALMSAKGASFQDLADEASRTF